LIKIFQASKGQDYLIVQIGVDIVKSYKGCNQALKYTENTDLKEKKMENTKEIRRKPRKRGAK